MSGLQELHREESRVLRLVKAAQDMLEDQPGAARYTSLAKCMGALAEQVLLEGGPGPYTDQTLATLAAQCIAWLVDRADTRKMEARRPQPQLELVLPEADWDRLTGRGQDYVLWLDWALGRITWERFRASANYAEEYPRAEPQGPYAGEAGHG